MDETHPESVPLNNMNFGVPTRYLLAGAPQMEMWLSWSKALAWKASEGVTPFRGFESRCLRVKNPLMRFRGCSGRDEPARTIWETWQSGLMHSLRKRT